MRMTKEEREFHRKVAAQCFNKTWDYLDMKRRKAEADREMLHFAHASRYHWGLVGTPRNLAVGDWILSRVYAELRQSDLALRFAESALDICEKSEFNDIMHTANEAMARAYAVSGDYPMAKGYLDRARQQLDSLKLGRKDKSVYLGQIEQTALMMGRR